MRIVAVGDLHCGSTLGLVPADGFPAEDGGLYEPSGAQRWLWERWVDFWQQVGRVDVLFLLGDLVDGDKFPQRWTYDQKVQVGCAVECLVRVLRPPPAHIFAVRGTTVHVGPAAEADAYVARLLGAPDDHIGFHLLVRVAGYLFDLAHHVGGRRLPWTMEATATALAAQFRAGDGEVPDFVLRGHVHYAADSGVVTRPRVLIVPGWQLRTAHALRYGGAAVLPVGGWIIDISPGHVDARVVLYRPERGRPIEVQNV